MLTSALVNSDRFVVVERAELKEILSEQELKAGGLVNKETGPKLGKLAGVQLLIYGAVTEFGTQDKGGGINFGFIGGRSPAWRRAPSLASGRLRSP
jgi:curli biogenesis system outer membrane secretion channel CsgG